MELTPENIFIFLLSQGVAMLIIWVMIVFGDYAKDHSDCQDEIEKDFDSNRVESFFGGGDLTNLTSEQPINSGEDHD